LPALLQPSILAIVREDDSLRRRHIEPLRDMTVRDQRILVHTGFRGRARIPAEAAVIERENVKVKACCAKRLQVTAYATVDGHLAGRTGSSTPTPFRV
jgi:hypothetical protein